MGPGTSSNSGGGAAQDKALADMIQGLRDESIRGATALLDEDLSTLGVPNPRILIVGCGGSGNNTLTESLTLVLRVLLLLLSIRISSIWIIPVHCKSCW